MSVGTVHGERYELVRKLGTGGFGSVWQARDTTLLRDVAVKLIEIDATAGDAHTRAVERFRREAQAIAGLAHPNVVTAFDFGVDADRAYLVMELVNGKSLAQMAADYEAAGQGPLDVATVLRVADDVCAGLGAAHAAGLVHRDLKPANLMVCLPSGQVKIVDFGIAQLSDRSKLTRTGSYMGTLPNIAPEQMGSRVLDGRADIYSLACLLHELLAGRSAYEADTPVQWLAAHHYATPAPLTDHLPDAPPALSALLGEMLAKDPAERPQTVDVIRQRIAAITREMSGGPVGAAQLVAATRVVPIPGAPGSRPPATGVPRVYQSGNAAAQASAPPVSSPPISVPPISAPPGSPVPPISGPAVGSPAPAYAPRQGQTPPPGYRPASGPPASGPPSGGPPSGYGPPSGGYPPGGRPTGRPGGPRVAPPPPPPRRNRAVIILVTLIALIIVGTAVVVVVSLADDGTTPNSAPGTSRSPAAAAPKQPIGMPCDLKIAFLGTTNGDFATEGISESQGVQLALAEYNATYPKCHVTSTSFDTDPADEAAPSDATMAAAAQHAVADPKVIGVVGPVTSGEAAPAYPVLQGAGLPGITPSSTVDDLTTRGWTVFHRAAGPRSTLFTSIAGWIKSQNKKVYVIDDGSLYGKQLSQLTVAAGGANVVRTERINDDGLYPATATRVLNAAPGIVVYGGFGITGGKLLAQLRRKGVTADFVVGDLTDQPPFEDYAGASVGSATVFCMCRVPAGDATEKAFAAAYGKRFGQLPGIFADIAYDATKMLLAGIMAGNFTRAGLNTWIGSHPYAGIAGSYRFGATGELSPDLVVVTRHPAGQTASQVVPTVHR